MIVPLAGAAAHFPMAHSYYSTSTRVAAALSFALCALAWSRYLRLRLPRMPWVEMFLSLQYANFGLAIANVPRPLGIDGIVPDPDAYEQAAWIATGASIVLLAVYEAADYLLRSVRMTWVHAPISGDTLSRAAMGYGVLSSAYVVLSTVTPGLRTQLFGGAAAVFDFTLNTYLFAAVATAAFLLRPSFRNRMLMWSAAGLGAFVSIWSSMLGIAAFTFLGISVVWLRLKGRVPLLPIAAGVGIFLILQPVKQHYRSLRWGDQGADVGVVEAWGESFAERGAEGLDVEAGRQRAEELGSFAYTVQMVPASVPHTGGLAYEMIVVSMIPRFVWPNKPDMTKYSLDPFLIELGLQTEEAAQTSTTGIPMVGHGYLEHGLAGSLGWMGLVALALAAFSAVFKEGITGIVCGASLVVSWLPGSASGFVGFFGSIFQVVVASILAGWLIYFLGGRRASPNAPRSRPEANRIIAPQPPSGESSRA